MPTASPKEPNRTIARNKAAERQTAILQRFSECGSILQACEESGVSRDCHYRWLATDPEYKERFAEAKRQAIDALEARVFQRANVESDRLAEFLLRGLRPEVYGDRFKGEISGPNGGPIEVGPVDLTKLSIERLEQLKAIAMEARAEKLITGGNGVIDAEVVEE